MEPARRGTATMTSQVVVVVVAVSIAVGLGFLAGATLESTPVLVPLPPPARTPPTPVIVLSRSFVLPAANISPSYVATGVGYWQSSFAGATFRFAWSSPFAVDACMHNWVTADPFSIPLSNLTDCTSQAGSVTWMNATRGNGSFTVPSQESWFAFYVLSPQGQGGEVPGSYSITNGGQTLETLPFGEYLPAGQLRPPYVYENLTIPLPPGYDAVTVQGNASQPISIAFNVLTPGGWNPFRTSWNLTAYYPSPPQLNVTMQALAFVPTNVTLGVVAFEA